MSQHFQSNAQPTPASANESSTVSELQVKFILMRRYTLTHAFLDEQYEHLAHLGLRFEAALFSRPPGPENPVWQFLVDILAEFWVLWPIEDDILVFVDFEEEKTLRFKEIISMFVMALEWRWSDPALRPEGDAGSVECMFDLLWFLHKLIDEMFPDLTEEPAVEDLASLPGLVEIQWM
ncbi:uncharacterized protein ARMOST_20352 [Armillaria ostoyae]|uniref:Uncharacterized protein n=1 Tax=Armillaria ostoyae TaxID=47428 RepID=A0A284S748_ARMOS|nr:uncharacterized protein ARMOST_20352 [Armillaria ostoyae]